MRVAALPRAQRKLARQQPGEDVWPVYRERKGSILGEVGAKGSTLH